MRTSTLTVVLVSALLVGSAGTAGALAAIGPFQPQQSTTGTTTGSGGGTSTGGTGVETTVSGGTSGPSIAFSDQQSTGETVLVQSATLPQNGFVVIYDSTRGGKATNQIIGASYLLSAGTSDNIRIPLDQPLNQTKSLTAVIHVDSNGNGQFDYVSSNGQQDPPLMQGSGRIVDIAQVTVQSSAASATTQANAGGSETTAANAGAASGDGATQTAASGGGSGDTDSGGANTSGNGGGGGGSGAFGPGFGFVVAVVALLAIALLAVRRN